MSQEGQRTEAEHPKTPDLVQLAVQFGAVLFISLGSSREQSTTEDDREHRSLPAAGEKAQGRVDRPKHDGNKDCTERKLTTKFSNECTTTTGLVTSLVAEFLDMDRGCENAKGDDGYPLPRSRAQGDIRAHGNAQCTAEVAREARTAKEVADNARLVAATEVVVCRDEARRDEEDWHNIEIVAQRPGDDVGDAQQLVSLLRSHSTRWDRSPGLVDRILCDGACAALILHAKLENDKPEPQRDLRDAWENRQRPLSRQIQGRARHGSKDTEGSAWDDGVKDLIAGKQ